MALLDEMEQALGKELVLAGTFENADSDDTFGACYQAETFCQKLGLSVGSLCSPMWTGVAKGAVDIAKWKNLSSKDKEQLDGVIVGPDFRNGPVAVYLSHEVCP